MAPKQQRRPDWLKVRLHTGETYRQVRGMVAELNLKTVCTEARCPNIYECWNAGTATFMILGDICTRRCGFCSVTTGRPAPGVDPHEPRHVAEAVQRLGLRHAVITSVDRDDLPDGGAAHFRELYDSPARISCTSVSVAGLTAWRRIQPSTSRRRIRSRREPSRAAGSSPREIARLTVRRSIAYSRSMPRALRASRCDPTPLVCGVSPESGINN